MMRRHLTTNSTTSAFVYAGGQVLAAPPANVIPLSEDLVTQFIFFGAGADNATFSVRIFGLLRCETASGDLDEDTYILIYLGTAACTLSTVVGDSSGEALTSTDRVVDTITWTKASEATSPKGPTTDIEASFSEGTSAEYSPADNTPAILYVPALGRITGLVMDYAVNGGSATSMNCLYGTNKI